MKLTKKQKEEILQIQLMMSNWDAVQSTFGNSLFLLNSMALIAEWYRFIFSGKGNK